MNEFAGAKRLPRLSKQKENFLTPFFLKILHQAKAFQIQDQQVIETRRTLQYEEEAMHQNGLHTSFVNTLTLWNETGDLYAK